MINSALKAAAAGLVLIGIILVGAASTETSQDISSVADRSDSIAQQQATTSVAMRTLRYITRVRSAIHEKNIDEALQNLQRARELLELTKAARPTSQIKDHIWVANEHMKYESAEETIDDLVLIDVELANLEGTVPIAAARRYLTKARAALEADDKKTAGQELERLTESLIFTEVDLPLAATEQQILKAQELLLRNKPAAADERLKAAEKGIQFISMGGDPPLARARTHLRQALKEYADEYYIAAKSDLTKASQWLRQAGERTDAKGKHETQQLAAKVEALRERLGTKTDDHAHTLSGFIHHSVALMEREAEDLWLQYKHQQATNTTFGKLMDAKLHFYYAEHELKKGNKIASIKKELGKTDRYLEEAQETADPQIRERIEYIRQEVHFLERDLGGDWGKAEDRYEWIMADLRSLIQKL